MRGLALAAGIFALAVVTGAAPATSVTPLQKAALKAVAQSHADETTRAAARAEVNRAAYLARTLPSGRREPVAVALGEVAALAGKLIQPRLVALTGELKANDDYFAKHYAPAPKTDIVDSDGVVYRYFAGRCFEFHPLANFGALNAHAASGDAEATQTLADALIARGVYQTGGIAWEYTFPFGGQPPWTSGMAQAVAAQAFARAAALVTDNADAYDREAAAAYRVIPRALLTNVAAGPWIKLYSFSSAPVLNAQLQTVISLQSYATDMQDADAAALAQRLQRSAAATLSRFDTGYWTYYALPNDPSPLDYQQFVVQLLKRLAKADTRFASAATRFASYEKQPPAFQLAAGSSNTVTFWISKPATVTAVTAGGPTKRVTVAGGWHTLAWPEPKTPGAFPVHVTARDWAGNNAAFDALPLVRATATLKRAPLGPPTAAPVAQQPSGTPAKLQIGGALSAPGDPASAALSGGAFAQIPIAWAAGQTVIDPTTASQLQALANSSPLIALTVAQLPADDAGRVQLAQFAASIAAAVPSPRALVLAPGPTPTTATAYQQAYAAVAAAVPSLHLGVTLDDPRLVPPGASVVTVSSLTAATAMRRALPTAQVVLGGLATAVPATLKALSCGSQVDAVVLARAGDAALPSVRDAIRAVQRGSYVCPGYAADATPFGQVVYPADLNAPGPISFQVTCSRDCIVLASLDRSDGTPIAANRASLSFGGPVTVTVPRVKIPPGSYRADVRIVSRVNPGTVVRYVSAPLVKR